MIVLREDMVAKNALAHSSFLLESVTRLHRGINQLDEERKHAFLFCVWQKEVQMTLNKETTENRKFACY